MVSFILFGVLVASSLILAFNIANTYRVGQVLVTLQAIWEGKRRKRFYLKLILFVLDTYTKPYCRAGPYIIGIVLGYLFVKTDKKKIHLHPIISFIILGINNYFYVNKYLR